MVEAAWIATLRAENYMCEETHHNPFILGLTEFYEACKSIVHIIDKLIAF